MCYDMERRESAGCLIRYGVAINHNILVVATQHEFTDRKSEAPHGVTIDGVTDFTEARFCGVNDLRY